MRRHRAPGEADSSTQELATWVEQVLDHLLAREKVSPKTGARHCHSVDHFRHVAGDPSS